MQYKNLPNSRPTRSFKAVPLMVWFAGLIIIVLAATATVFMYMKYADTERSNASLKEMNATLNKKIAASSRATTSAPSDDVNGQDDAVMQSKSQADLTVKIEAARFVNPSGSVTSSGHYVGIRMSLINTSDESIQIDPAKFTIKDSNANAYPQMGFQGATTLPDGWGTGTLALQTVASGATIVGNVLFPVQNDKITGVIFYNDTAGYPVSVAPLTD